MALHEGVAPVAQPLTGSRRQPSLGRWCILL